MFGGVGFLLHGNMCVGVHGSFLILRLGEEEASATMKEKYTKEFDITGKAMKGWVMVHDEGLGKDKRLKELAERAIRFVRTLPKK